jgi:hypothetical protein
MPGLSVVGNLVCKTHSVFTSMWNRNQYWFQVYSLIYNIEDVQTSKITGFTELYSVSFIRLWQLQIADALNRNGAIMIQ